MNVRGESKTNERALAALEELFPHYADTAQRLARESETFWEICTDFVECSETLERLAELGAQAEARIQEYSDLKARLEQELLEYLEGPVVAPRPRPLGLDEGSGGTGRASPDRASTEHVPRRRE